MTAAAAHGGLFGGINRRELVLWSGAALIVASIHGGGGWYLGSRGAEVSPPASAPPAVMLELPPMVINADPVAIDTADPIDSIASPTPQEIMEQIDPVEQVEKPVEEVTEPEAEATPEVAEEVIPDLVEAPLPEVAVAIPEPRPEIEKPKPVVKPVREKKPVEKKKPEPVKEAKAEKPEKVEKKAPANSVAQQKAAKAGVNSKVNGGGSGSSGSSVSPQKWNSQVVAHIRRYMRSVPNMRRGGVAYVSFTVNSSGAVVSASLARASGEKVIDDAALSLVRRASPVPAPPDSVPASGRSLLIPIELRSR